MTSRSASASGTAGTASTTVSSTTRHTCHEEGFAAGTAATALTSDALGATTAADPAGTTSTTAGTITARASGATCRLRSEPTGRAARASIATRAAGRHNLAGTSSEPEARAVAASAAVTSSTPVATTGTAGASGTTVGAVATTTATPAPTCSSTGATVTRVGAVRCCIASVTGLADELSGRTSTTAVRPRSTVAEQQTRAATVAHLTGGAVVGEGEPVADQDTGTRVIGRAVADEHATHRCRDHRTQLGLGERNPIPVPLQIVEAAEPPPDRRPQLGDVIGVCRPVRDDALEPAHPCLPLRVRRCRRPSGTHTGRRCLHGDPRVGHAR